LTLEQAHATAVLIIKAARDVEYAVAYGLPSAEILAACANLRAWLADVEAYAEEGK